MIKIDFADKSGRIKAIHGVNNGPVCAGSLVDVSHFYQELEFPIVRLHDTNWPHPREVDIPFIFPNFEKDVLDEKSYDFRATDAYIKSIKDTGADILYRLGVSIEHTEIKYFTQPPKDYEKWAQICVQIIRHYNEGWANGFHYNIQYWEIWNEPENFPNTPPEKNPMWAGSYEDYYRLYQTSANIIKREFPKLKVGGPAYTMVNPEFLEQFLKVCRDNQVPLDFMSWHNYIDSPEKVRKNAKEMRELLDLYGLKDTESIMDEWNYIFDGAFAIDVAGGSGGMDKKSAAVNTKRAFEKMQGIEGAACVLGTLILLQDLSVDKAMFYDAAPSSFFSIFDKYGNPCVNFNSFFYFKKMLSCPMRVSSQVLEENVYCLAGTNEEDNKAGIVIACCDNKEHSSNMLEFIAQYDGICTMEKINHEERIENSFEITKGKTVSINLGNDKDGICFIDIRKI